MSGHDSKKGEIPELKEEPNSQYKPLLALYAAKRISGIVVNIESNVTSIVPIFRGRVMHEIGVETVGQGALKLTGFLKELMQRRNIPSGYISNEGRDTLWHSSAHILGESLERAYGCKLCIGPCTTRGEGFYYDAYYNDVTLNEAHFGLIQTQAQKAVAEKQPFERIEVSRVETLEMFAENKFKVEIINELPEGKTITVYRCGPLVDLCRGPHIPNTSFVKAFACLKASSSYWRGKADRESLQRVYEIAFPDSKRLKEYLHLLRLRNVIIGY